LADIRLPMSLLLACHGVPVTGSPRGGNQKISLELRVLIKEEY